MKTTVKMDHRSRDRSVTNKKKLPVYITALITATVLLLCTVLITLDRWTMSNVVVSAPQDVERRRLMDENFAFEIDDDEMAAILAEPLRESSEDKETVSARNQERSTLGRKDESLSRFVLQQQRRREHAAKLKKQANEAKRADEEKTKTDANKLQQEKQDALKREKVRKRKQRKQGKQQRQQKNKKKQQRQQNKRRAKQGKDSRERFHTGRTPTPKGFRRHQRNGVPCAFKDYETQRRCLVQKYDHCVAQQNGFCSHSDLQRALRDLEPFPVGSRVKAKWRDGYEPVIASVVRVHNKDGTYDVLFDPPSNPSMKWKNVPEGRQHVPASDMKILAENEKGTKAREKTRPSSNQPEFSDFGRPYSFT